MTNPKPGQILRLNVYSGNHGHVAASSLDVLTDRAGNPRFSIGKC